MKRLACSAAVVWLISVAGLFGCDRDIASTDEVGQMERTGERWQVCAEADFSGSPYPGLWWVDDDGHCFVVVDHKDGEPIDDRFLVSADTQIGRETWSVRLADGVPAPTQLVRLPGMPLVLYRPGRWLSGIDASNGHNVWLRSTPEPHWSDQPDRASRGAGALAAWQNRLLLLRPQELAVLDPGDGSTEFTVPLNGRGEGVSYDAPICDGDMAYFIVDGDSDTRHRMLTAVDLETRAVTWQVDVGPVFADSRQPSSQGRCAVGGDAVLCLADLPDVEAYSESSGDAEAVAVIERKIPPARLICVDRQSGEPRWEAALDGWPSMDGTSPVVAGSRVFVHLRGDLLTEKDHSLRIFDLETGAPMAGIAGAVAPWCATDGTVVWHDLSSDLIAIAPVSDVESIERVNVAGTHQDWWAHTIRPHGDGYALLMGWERRADGAETAYRPHARVVVIGRRLARETEP